MIGKTKIGSHALGALNYCYYEKDYQTDEVRGEILFIQNLTLSKQPNGHYNMKHLAKQFGEVARMNQRVKQYVWHQSFSFPIGETPSVEQMQVITQAFSKEFGFDENQLVAFRHTDTAHEHFHIVANRVNLNGENSAIRYENFHRIGRFCRAMEKELGLTTTLGMISDFKQQRKQTIANSASAEYIKTQIDKVLHNISSMSEFKEQLKEAGIETTINRGISFQYQNERFKGSDFGREYSLMNLGKRFALNVSQPEQTFSSQMVIMPTSKQESNPLPILDNTLTAAPNSPKRKLDGNEDDDEEELKRKRKRNLKL